MVIGLISVLMALITPAVQNSRNAARLIECRHRVRELALAILNWENARSRFPAASTIRGPDPGQPIPRKNWVVDILPWIDQRALADQWNYELALTSPLNQQLAEQHISTLTCPADVSVNGAGDLSFAVPRGLGVAMAHFAGRGAIFDAFRRPLDLNGDGQFMRLDGEPPEDPPTDYDVAWMTGLFVSENDTPGWGRATSPTRSHSLRTIRDGAGQTLLLAENIRTGFDPDSRFSNWASVDPERIYLFVGPSVCRNNRCEDGAVDLSLANSGEQRINSGRTQPEGKSPWMSSFHDGGVNVAYCDGSASFLKETVDGRVLFQLFTPAGAMLGALPLRE